MNSGEPEQEFQRAGTGVPASRNRSSSESAGINPYDGPAVIIKIFIIDNPGFLKIHFISNGS